MKSIFKTFVLSVLMIAQVHFAYAQSASLLPNAVQTFLDKNGNPLASGSVTTYIPNTTTKKTTWQDSGKLTPWGNPLSINAAGHAPGDKGIYGDGAYRQVVKDRNNNLIWDQVTEATGGSGTGVIGDGLPVGTILPWSGIIAPANYQFTYGQTVSRASFPELYQAITYAQNITCVGGSPIITNITDTSFVSVGAVLESTCATGSPTVISKTSSTVTISANSVISVTTSGIFYPYGNGDGVTTFRLPDTRGYVVSGRCNMGGSNCSNLNSTYFSSNSNNTPSGLNALGGGQNSTLIQSNLPAYTPSGSIVSTTSLFGGPQTAALWSSGAGTLGGIAGGAVYSIGPAITASTSSTFTGNAQGGSSAPISIVQPTITLNYIIKVTPDVNLNSTYGVAAIGGMTGIIACGAGIICSANTISAVPQFIPANSVANAQLAQAPALTILGNGTNATANKTDLAGTTNQIMRVDSAGTTLGFGAVNLASSSAVGATLLPLANGGTNAALTANNGGILWSNATQAQVLAGTATARLPLLSGSTAIPVWGAFTSPASVTSGGVAYFSSTSAMSSSALLAANQIILGGGAGVAPSTLGSLGTTTTLLHGNAAGAPTFGQIVSADITTNTVSNSNLAQVGAATLKGNPSNATANATDFTIQGLTNLAAPSATLDFIPVYNHTTGTIQNVTPGAIASSSVSGVASVGGLTGVVGLTAVDLAVSGSNIQLSAGRKTLSSGCAINATATVTCADGSAGANNGTYTTPTGALWLEVELVGGGGGGGGSGTSAGNGGAGGNTTFSTLTGNGSAATTSGGVVGGVGGASSGGFANKSGANGGSGSGLTSSIGGFGANSPYGGAGVGGSPGAGLGVAAGANTGSGGGGGGVNATVNGGGGGGAGGFVRAIIQSPSATYSYAIGAGGTAGTAGTGGASGGAGGSGFIQIIPHFN